MNKLLLRTLAVLALSLLSLTWAAARAEDWPDRIPLPDGFQPEGIAMGYGSTAYVGSVGSGAIYAVDLRTGEGEMFVEAQSPQSVLGLMMDGRTGYLYAAGNKSGNALVYDARSGELVRDIQLTADPNTLINDVAIAWDAVYFTDSHLPVYYKVPLAPGGKLPDVAAAETITLTGEFEFLPDAPDGNANGIVVSRDGKRLIISTTDAGKLYMIDAATGEATLLQLDQEREIYDDGLVLVGTTLYVINYNDTVYQIALAPDWKTGTVQGTITDPSFEAISTAARRGNWLYVVNARWDAEQMPATEFWLTRVGR